MSRQFLHVTFNFGEKMPWEGPSEDDLKAQFDKAVDWMCYAPNCWILWTSRTPAEWFRQLKPLLGPKDNVFICKIDLSPGNRAGWVPQWVWDWIRKPRAPGLTFKKPA
jgi:hypothetical protein